MDTKKKPATDEARANFESSDLAATLLVRMGLMEPADVERIARRDRKPRRRLRTPKDVIRAIGQVVAEIEAGTLQPQAARARLYALQTLLVAMRMQAEGELANEPLQLNASATAETQPPPSHVEHLLHLQQLTAEDPGQ